ncbi:chemerin-like receptor 1 [Trichomycterus rosablanca]|uniref:chemerin-like receptor 1 n=1 Tax=Trichomycterus rosablanca TaxID=2290929 RepID=UPI002F357DA4
MSGTNVTPGFDYDKIIGELEADAEYPKHIRMLFIISYSTICIVGLVLNSWVVVAGSCAYQKLLDRDTAVWVLTLAVTHLICLIFLPFQLLYAWFHFNWRYEGIVCKFASYAIYFSFFSTGTMLSMWSISSTIKSSTCIRKCWPRQLGRGATADLFMVLFSWTLAAVLAMPSLFSRELRYTKRGLECIDDFDFDNDKSTNDGEQKLLIVVLYRFLLGIALPGFLMGISCCLKREEGRRDYGRRGLRQISCWIKVAHFVCWTPLMLMAMLQITKGQYAGFEYALPAGTVLAAAHCCVNPVIYLLVRCDVKMKWMSLRLCDVQDCKDLMLLQ